MHTALRTKATHTQCTNIRCVTVSDRVFRVAAAPVWNGLPPDVIASPSLLVLALKIFELTLSVLQTLASISPMQLTDDTVKQKITPSRVAVHGESSIKRGKVSVRP